ncbi:GyrI-like domain-containing protein [Clostridium sp. BJN0013]|uniref:MerR family transcriptional regulator n=1 Tax=Clostridium sp. BJN0013 TaxID=3236840 RepID=UPI0034C615F3
MYTIGQFSKIAKLSSKVLRHYDKIGLLKPEYVNADNGYRYYDLKQIKHVIVINKLKSYGFFLEEIKSILFENDLEELKRLMEIKIKSLTEELNYNEFILNQMKYEFEKLVKGEDIMEENRKFNIILKDQEPLNVLSIRDNISMDYIGGLIGKVYENVYKNGLKPTGNIMSIYYLQNEEEDFNHDNADVEVCIPVDKEFNSDSINTRVLEGGLHAYTTFIGPYSEISQAYGAMMEWVKHNKYKISRPPFEKYIKGPEEGHNPQDFITEIYFPVVKM